MLALTMILGTLYNGRGNGTCTRKTRYRSADFRTTLSFNNQQMLL